MILSIFIIGNEAALLELSIDAKGLACVLLVVVRWL